MTVDEWLDLPVDRWDEAEVWPRLQWPLDFWNVHSRIHTRRFMGEVGPWEFAGVPVGVVYHYGQHLLRLGGFTDRLEILIRDLVAAEVSHVTVTAAVRGEMIQLDRVQVFEAET